MAAEDYINPGQELDTHYRTLGAEQAYDEMSEGLTREQYFTLIRRRKMAKKSVKKVNIVKGKKIKVSTGTYYVAAQHISASIAANKPNTWTKHTLVEAVRHASEMLMTDHEVDAIAIVKIVKVVRRQATPVEVVDVE